MLEEALKKLEEAVDRLNQTLMSSNPQPKTITPEVINPNSAPKPPPAATPQATTPQTTTPVDTQGVTADSLKAKASDLARRLGPRATIISEKLKEMGTDRLSGLTQTNFVAFDLWLNAEIAQLTNGAG